MSEYDNTRSPSFGEPPTTLHPDAIRMRKENPEALTVFAAMLRAVAEKNEPGQNSLDHWSDAEVATVMMDLKDKGLVSWWANEEEETFGYTLHQPRLPEPPASGASLRQPSRRERRRKGRRK